jgi:penicillin-binding protein 2
MTKYLETADIEWYKSRLAGVVFCLFGAFALLFIRLFYLQVIQGSELRRLSENNCIRLESIDAPRGLLFDRNGERLVDNRPSFNLAIVVKDARPLEETVRRLAIHLGESPDVLLQTIRKNRSGGSYRPVVIRRDMGRELLAVIEVHKFELPGVVVQVVPRRHYIEEEMAAHFIGYMSEISQEELKSGRYEGCRRGDFIGKFGVEKTYEDLLRGKRGGRQVEVDVTGRVVRVLKTVPAVPGHNIYLSIDKKLQQRTEALLAEVTGAAVAIDPATGEVLAMASNPTFDQNAFVSGLTHEYWNSLISNPDRPMSNKAIQGEYPPASTYKIVTALAGLEERIIDPSTTIFCPGYYQFGNRAFRCWKKGGHGKVNLNRALAESCDVYFYQVGQKLGIDRLAWYAKALGLGVATGIELENEAAGLVPTAAWKKRRTGVRWQRGETLSVAIGQGYNLVTPLQMASLTAAIGNGGTLYRPLVSREVKTAEGRVVQKGRPTVTGRIPVSNKNLDMVRKGLWEVVNGSRGTARRARLKEVEISGKTGTAQVVSRKKDENEDEKKRAHHLKAHAWFVAYAPTVNPRIALAVIVEHGEHGSSAAAPIAREMVKTYLQTE